jgi:hypothetical protein
MPDFQRIERDLRDLSRLVDPRSPADAEFDEFIEHNEFGLALEILAYAAVSGRRHLPDDVADRVRAIAAAMSLDGNAILSDMAARARKREGQS